ncbi:death domain-containing protein 1 [Salarias fasciatus]|uniref:death domain-containing protein 1 n=1 Tax=Salarias fasciatus TaxID=181472 RepID=UPI001176CE55|nr:death domain-containing protein 1 [Salarias fasciatus]
MTENAQFIPSAEAAREFEDVRRHGDVDKGQTEEEMFSDAEDKRKDERKTSVLEERECKQKLLGVLGEMNAVHSDRLTVWRGTLRECAALLQTSPADGDPSPSESSLSDLLQCVGEDFLSIVEKLHFIIMKLDAAVLQSFTEEVSGVCSPLQDSADTKNIDSEPDEQEDEDGGDGRRTAMSPDTEQTPDSTFSSSGCNNTADSGKELQAKGQLRDFLEKSIHPQADLEKETEKDQERITEESKEEKKEETKSDWITVGLTGQVQDADCGVPDACFIKVPAGTHAALRCEVADSLSCLMVTDSEELVSRVIRVKVQDGNTFHFPLTVIVPFHARYRGNYRDVAVKMMDEERRVSYVSPVTTEGLYGGQKGSFAEVKVYSLGLFAVVSCLKRENYTVQRRGLSLRLVMDPRICLNYLPGSFTVPVMAQAMIQPVEAVLLTAVKSRNDEYRSVASTSPLLYLTHPRSQPLRRALAVTLPCPPNPEKRKSQKENQDSLPVSASLQWDHRVSNRKRISAASVKSKERYNESLAVLGSVEKQWRVLDQVSAKNQQNGLVSFDVMENFDRLLVVRLLGPLPPGVLASLAEELEEAVCCHSVTVVLQRRQDEPHAVLVAALPSRDLGWELSRLRAQGYSGPAETSPEVCMREADQLLLRFSGNITSKVCAQDDKNKSALQRLTFHSQRKNHLLLQLTEVDPFGNYSSPHYKGTLLFHKVTRGQLEWRGDEAALKDTKLLGEPVCKLSLTLPKKARKTNQPITARVKMCEDSDSLSDSLLQWLSGELSEEELPLLVASLRLRRSAAQMAKLRAGDGPSSRAFHMLATWRRGLPAIPHQPKASQLARCLAKSGRPDLARELLLRQAAGAGQSPR